MPLVPVVLHPSIVARHSPGLQLDEVLLAGRRPVSFRRLLMVGHVGSVLAPRGKSQAGTSVHLTAIELGDQGTDMDILAGMELVAHRP